MSTKVLCKLVGGGGWGLTASQGSPFQLGWTPGVVSPVVTLLLPEGAQMKVFFKGLPYTEGNPFIHSLVHVLPTKAT